jgi:hypothetical protein
MWHSYDIWMDWILPLVFSIAMIVYINVINIMNKTLWLND